MILTGDFSRFRMAAAELTQHSIRFIRYTTLGARIEVNGNYIGDTPITTTLQCSPDGRFLEHTTIRALPTIPGQYVQSKFFDGGYQYSHQLNNSVPSRVFFDMRLGPVSSDINVNVQ